MRILLAAVLVLALVVLAAAPERTALAVALLAMVVAFLLGSAQLAIDLIELIPAELAADGALLVALAVAFTRITSAGRPLIGALVVVALATQALPLSKRIR